MKRTTTIRKKRVGGNSGMLPPLAPTPPPPVMTPSRLGIGQLPRLIVSSSSDGSASPTHSPKSPASPRSFSSIQKKKMTRKKRAGARMDLSPDNNSIIRGAALVRENILKNSSETQHNGDDNDDDDDDDWSDPFENANNDSTDPPGDLLDDTTTIFSTTPTVRADQHWAQMALQQQNEEEQQQQRREPFLDSLLNTASLFDKDEGSNQDDDDDDDGVDGDHFHDDNSLPPPLPPPYSSPFRQSAHETTTSPSTPPPATSPKLIHYDPNYVVQPKNRSTGIYSTFQVVSYEESSPTKESRTPDDDHDHDHYGVSDDVQFFAKQWAHILPSPPASPTRPSSSSSPSSSPPPMYSNIKSPLSIQYHNLQTDQGFVHAQKAGYLWQTLVGQHVRFPSKWYDGARSPPMGVDNILVTDYRSNNNNSKKLTPRHPWRYVARHRIYENAVLNDWVRSRKSPGRLLLHIVVRDMMSWIPIQDIAIGIYHPNARGIRPSAQPLPRDEACREVWMAIRKRIDQVSVVDKLLTGEEEESTNVRSDGVEANVTESPLGARRKVTNLNMRAVFGEKPPLHTLFIQESELYENLTLAAEAQGGTRKPSPALLLLQEYLLLD